MASPDDLTDLVNDPSETLATEYKSKLDLADNRSKANFARHVAALANHGGGYLVFGFNDDLTPAAQTEFPAIDRDAVASVVKSYLEPPFQCDVRVVTGSSGNRHTIVVVPSHGGAPICARRDGPQDAKGNPQGIKSGAYYIRKPGPESQAILTPSEWAPVIRRCALSERAAILGAIDVVLKGGPAENRIEARVRQWHDALARAYGEGLAAAGKESLRSYGYMHFSFGVHRDGEPIADEELERVIERCNAEADAVTRTHWGPFVVLHRIPIAPRYRTAPDVSDGEHEFLEATVIESQDSTHASDMWRVSNDGLASLIKGWWEDTPLFGQPPQTCISPNWLEKEVAGIVLFARAFANSMDIATAVTFRIEWTGLKGRRPFDPHRRWHFSGHQAEEDRRVANSTVSLAELNGDWVDLATKLMRPVAKAIGLEGALTPQRLLSETANWARQP